MPRKVEDNIAIYSKEDILKALQEDGVNEENFKAPVKFEDSLFNQMVNVDNYLHVNIFFGTFQP
jgi:hypothetical protein